MSAWSGREDWFKINIWELLAHWVAFKAMKPIEITKIVMYIEKKTKDQPWHFNRKAGNREGSSKKTLRRNH